MSKITQGQIDKHFIIKEVVYSPFGKLWHANVYDKENSRTYAIKIPDSKLPVGSSEKKIEEQVHKHLKTLERGGKVVIFSPDHEQGPLPANKQATPNLKAARKNQEKQDKNVPGKRTTKKD